MFGYVTPCKMELKIKDYEKFKAYYCGLCKTIKKDYGEFPRFCLNYDMTFLAILLDSLNKNPSNYYKEHCIVHPIKKKIIIKNNEALNYAAFFNVSLAYFKLLDNVEDDHSIKSKILSIGLKKYIYKNTNLCDKHMQYIKNCLANLYNNEKNYKNKNIDEISHHFADLTGYILSSYQNFEFKEKLYWLGYNLGKWIYIIDAFDDLEKDIQNNKFNVINNLLNYNKLPYNDFKKSIHQKIDFILINCGTTCLHIFNQLPIYKNKNLLFNILQFGMVEKMDKILRSVKLDEQSI